MSSPEQRTSSIPNFQEEASPCNRPYYSSLNFGSSPEVYIFQYVDIDNAVQVRRVDTHNKEDGDIISLISSSINWARYWPLKSYYCLELQ
jgi:hypothetical protein